MTSKETSFWEELTDLIVKHKKRGVSLGELIADMEGEIDGLNNELADEEEENSDD